MFFQKFKVICNARCSIYFWAFLHNVSRLSFTSVFFLEIYLIEKLKCLQFIGIKIPYKKNIDPEIWYIS